MSPREKFATFYYMNKTGRGGLRQSELQRAMTSLEKWFTDLALPGLTTDQRTQMGKQDLPGLQQLMLALRGALVNVPDLATGLKLIDETIADLCRKDVDLHTLLERATTTATSAGRSQRLCAAELKQRCDQVLTTAA